MTLEQFDARLTAVEQAVEELRQTLPQSNGKKENERAESEFLREEDIIPGVEYDVVLDVPPHHSFTVKAIVVSVKRGPSTLALSEAEWEDLKSGVEDE